MYECKRESTCVKDCEVVMKVAVVIGHQVNSPGAINKNFEASEFSFNEKLAKNIQSNYHSLVNFSQEVDLEIAQAKIEIVYRETNYQELPGQINNLKPDLIISLHCNAFNTEVNGCEMLYYHKSVKGKEIAKIFQIQLVDILENKDRGTKPKGSEDRGGYLLKMTNAPCIIAEPFFIDNDDEYLNAKELFDDGTLTLTYCDAINKALIYLKDS